MTEMELDDILTFRWPCVIAYAKQADDKWLIGFALSIAKQGRKRDWFPSQKQQAYMLRLLAEASAERAVTEAGEVFET